MPIAIAHASIPFLQVVAHGLLLFGLFAVQGLQQVCVGARVDQCLTGQVDAGSGEQLTNQKVLTVIRVVTDVTGDLLDTLRHIQQHSEGQQPKYELVSVGLPQLQREIGIRAFVTLELVEHVLRVEFKRLDGLTT